VDMALRKIGTKQESSGQEQRSMGSKLPAKNFNSLTTKKKKKKKKNANTTKR